ncbi:MAG: hypothetical protein WCB03_08390 [Rouxiella badensis]|uniref:hypothetical protein n=1 Tax=Rouxiella badensis TaxID=1646377 RepID=UPI003C62B1D6
MTAAAKEKLDWSDALFSCVYLWVVGRPIMSEDATAAMQRHDPHSPLGGLAIRTALTCLIECFGVEMVPERVVLTDNMLHLLEGGLERVSALLEQEVQYRLEVKA